MPNRVTPSFLAFDLGASSSRAVLGTLEDGAMRLEELHRFATPILEEEGHLFWDVELIWRELATGLRRAQQASGTIRSVSVDSWGVDYVRLNNAGEPLRNPYCYRDPRLDGVMERAWNAVPAEEIYARTGIQFLPFNTLYQVIADGEEDADGRQRPALHLTIADYFNYRFSGYPAIELSMASTTQMMDVHTRQWSEPLLRVFGLDAGRWPDIVPSGTKLGLVLQAPGIMTIATCSHDTGSAVAAAPAVPESGDWAYVSCGTWSLLGMERTSPLLTPAARQAGFTNEAGVDGTIRFLKNLTGLWPLQECVREWREQGGPVEWEDLEAQAQATPSSGARINLEDPRFLARGGMEDRLRAYCREHGFAVPAEKGELVRVILESIADSYRRALDDLEHVTGARFQTIHLFGGGSRNRMLCQLTADACGVRVVAGPAEATALGNLLIQARAMGELPAGSSMRDVSARSDELHVYTPER